MIADLNNLVNGLLGSDSGIILERLESAKNIVTSKFEEYEDVAIESMNKAVETLQKAYDDRIAFEKLQADQEEQAKAMAEKQAELDAKQAELDAKEAAQKQAERDEKIKSEAAAKAKADAEKAAEEKAAEKKAEADARESNTKHKSKINNAAAKCLVDEGIDELIKTCPLL
ncbi:MAG: hypothetical protein ACC657_17400 [Thiohalomonadales bacterium]